MITSVRQTVRFIPREYDVAAIDHRLARIRLERDAVPADSDQAANIDSVITMVEAWRSAVAQVVDGLGRPVPVYLIRPPTVFDLEEIKARLAERGAIELPSDATLLAAAREIAEQLADVGEGERSAGYINLIDAAQAELMEGGMLPATAHRVETMYRSLSVFEDFAVLVAQRQRWLGMMPLIAAQMCLVGWENVVDREDPTRPLVFHRGRLGVPEDLMGRIPVSELRAAGRAAWDAGHVTQADAKNSAPPSSSGSSPMPSTAAAPATA